MALLARVQLGSSSCGAKPLACREAEHRLQNIEIYGLDTVHDDNVRRGVEAGIPPLLEAIHAAEEEVASRTIIDDAQGLKRATWPALRNIVITLGPLGVLWVTAHKVDVGVAGVSGDWTWKV